MKKIAFYEISEDIHENKKQRTYRHCHQCTVETVEHSAVSRNDAAGILHIVMTLPLRLEKVPINTCHIHDYGQYDGVSQ